jgi:hypothetical protein
MRSRLHYAFIEGKSAEASNFLSEAGVDTCRMIYTYPDFPSFAVRNGMKSAWGKYGEPDRLS